MTISRHVARRVGIFAAGGALLAAMAFSAVAGTSAAQPGGQNPPINVIVTNTPLPVTGEVAVAGDVEVSGEIAATQSGSWDVGITGTPTVKSGDSTVLMGSFAGTVPGGGAFTEAVSFADATPYRSVRVATNCFDGAACASILVRVYTVVGGRSYLMEQFPMQNFVASTRVYEVIGTNVTVQLLNNNAGPNENIGVAVFGRPN